MRVQIELTTRCNFECFYCAGRGMNQGDMPYDDFERILDKHVARYGVPEEVMLQGEGEPTLHKRFFDMAAKVQSIGSIPNTITNGTYKHPKQFFESFRDVGVSLDTLDERTAERIGRSALQRVIRNIEILAESVRVTVYSVAIAKDLHAVRQFCRERGLRHFVQPLQTKPDYARRYPDFPISGGSRRGEFWCGNIAYPLKRYYALDGTELPCCYIKDLSLFNGYEEMAAQAARGVTPDVCTGCLHGQSPERGA